MTEKLWCCADMSPLKCHRWPLLDRKLGLAIFQRQTYRLSWHVWEGASASALAVLNASVMVGKDHLPLSRSVKRTP